MRRTRFYIVSVAHQALGSELTCHELFHPDFISSRSNNVPTTRDGLLEVHGEDKSAYLLARQARVTVETWQCWACSQRLRPVALFARPLKAPPRSPSFHSSPRLLVAFAGSHPRAWAPLAVVQPNVQAAESRVSTRRDVLHTPQAAIRLVSRPTSSSRRTQTHLHQATLVSMATDEKNIVHDAAPLEPVDSSEEHMSIAQYASTRVTTLRPPMAKAANPFKLLAMLNTQQWLFFLVAFFAWSWDAFDFFTVSLTVSDLAKTFGKTTTDITWGITLVLMFRSVGSTIFGIAADRCKYLWQWL